MMSANQSPPPAARGIASSNVAKYHVGQFVEQLGASGLTGMVIRIEASAPGQSLAGPGTIFVQPQPGSDAAQQVPLWEFGSESRGRLALGP